MLDIDKNKNLTRKSSSFLNRITDPKLPLGVLPEDLFRVKIINYTILIPLIGTTLLLCQSLLNNDPDYPIALTLILVMIVLILFNNTRYHYYSKAVLFIVVPIGVITHGYYSGPMMRMDLNFIMLGALAFGVYGNRWIKTLITIWSVIGVILYNIIAKPDAPMAMYVNANDPYVIFAMVAIVSALIIHIYSCTQKENLDKLSQLNESLANNNNDLKDALLDIQQRNIIFQSIGHDLRTPAAAFIKLSQKINHLIKTENIERLKELGAQFESSGNKISYLIQNILNWANSEVEDYELQIQLINLNEYITSSIKVHQILAQEKGMIITTDIAPNIEIDSDINYLAIIINNLLHNAIKFSHANSNISINASQYNDTVSLSIIDHGVGMTEAKLSEIAALNNIKSTKGTSQEKGYGLGMKTCYRIANRLGITLDIESEVDQGTTLTLWFPHSQVIL